MAGFDAAAVDYGGLGAEPTYEAVASRIAARLEGSGWTLVVHSGAGGLVPGVVEAMSDPAGVIFVDAILPHPGRSWAATAPAALVERLASLAIHGMLPPWNGWFASDPLPGMLTNGSLRAAFAEALPLTPASWLSAVAPELHGWSQASCAFLQLSAGYAAEAADARARGWPTHRLDLHHLAMITDPGKVAGALLSLEAA
ncbi:MAG TPA: hypothetical protein VFE03_16925 [Caulobacteraceae bacterium]|nr:hypothetical protein [Caulobacteraceae bacterium]